jgi:CheY-like chemotaxis protein
MLEGLPIEIEVARDGVEALQHLQERRYDLAFLDVQMPGRDGLSVTREWREHEAKAGLDRLPIVALTAQALPEDLQASLDAGCDRHLSKPVSRGVLIDTVRQMALTEAPDRGA